MESSVNRIYTSIQRLEKEIYEPTFQGKRYEDDARAMLLNYWDTLVSTRTKKDEIEQIIGVIMGQHYSIKEILKLLGVNVKHAVTSDLE